MSTTWTPAMVDRAAMVVNYYFHTEECPGCRRDMLVHVEHWGRVIIFTCPKCGHLIPHDAVKLLDRQTLQEQWGWTISDDAGDVPAEMEHRA
jgi:tRNA(Ile2) C34 agmatinyltransferase TiaS